MDQIAELFGKMTEEEKTFFVRAASRNVHPAKIEEMINDSREMRCSAEHRIKSLDNDLETLCGNYRRSN